MFLNTKRKHDVKPEVNEIIKKETNVDEVFIDELVYTYSANEIQEKSESSNLNKRPSSSLNIENQPSTSRNPFAKKIKHEIIEDDFDDNSFIGEDAQNLSLLSNIKENAQSPDSAAQKSRFFDKYNYGGNMPKEVALDMLLDSVDHFAQKSPDPKEPDEIDPNEFIFFPEKIEVGDGDFYKYDKCTESFRPTEQEAPKDNVLAFEKWKSKYENKKVSNGKNCKNASRKSQPSKSKINEGPKKIVLAFDKWKAKYENSKQSNLQK